MTTKLSPTLLTPETSLLLILDYQQHVCLLYPVLHAQRDGFETYFVTDAVGGSTVMAHETAIQRMVQAGSQPITVNSMLTEWTRDWGTTPYTKDFVSHMAWYGPEIERIRKRLRAQPYQGDIA